MTDIPLSSALLRDLMQNVGTTEKLCIAYSGGLDSTVLLHLCHTLKQKNANIQLSAIHVHHGLSQNADAWEAHCRSICSELSIPLAVEHISIVKKSRTSLEQQAREHRYKAIENSVSADQLILLAQHQDDQAETYLLQLARGSGGKGLSAMPRQFISKAGNVFCRPLLGATRQDLLEYAQQHALKWIEDESNENEHFDRNFLRHKVMPALKSRWPSISATISRSAQHHAHSELVVQEYMALLSKDIIDSQQRLCMTPYLALSAHSQEAILRFWLNKQTHLMPSTATLQQIVAMVTARQDAQPECCWSDYAVRRFKNYLYLCRPLEESVPETVHLTLAIDTPVSHPLLAHDLELRELAPDVLITDVLAENETSVALFNMPLTDITLKIDFGGFSRRVSLEPKRPSKTLKQWFQEWEVPPWQRACVPILSYEGKIIAVGEHISFEALMSKNTSFKQTAGNSSAKVMLVVAKKSPQKAGKD